MKTIYSIVFHIAVAFTGMLQTSNAQCTWDTVLTDGFEYQTVCPDLIPGATIHNTPKSYAVRTGTYSLYLNFTNCVNGTGTCAGAKVYERGFSVCRNQPIRFSTWLTTSFSGTQSNVRIKISDSNGNVLDDQLQILAPYFPAWIEYQSNVTPLSDSVFFTMYTNVGGGPGNDLSMDDFLLEKCDGSNIGNSTSPGAICENASFDNLYPILQGVNDTTGTWSGPSVLGGGYLGTFIPGISQTGAYIYENHFFGTGAGCPLAYDTLLVSLNPAPVVNLGADTTICTNQTLLLNAGSSPGNTYLWNNGVTGPNVLAFTNSPVNITNSYSVVVTGTNGCTGIDTIIVSFEVCSGLIENATLNNLAAYPNPSNGLVYVNSGLINGTSLPYSVYNSLGEVVAQGYLNSGTTLIELPETGNGMFYLKVNSGNNSQVITLVKNK